MEFSFLGRGSAFNTKEGNNCAYYKNKDGVMLLIDCGETTFVKIKDTNLLDDVTKLYVVITHTHTDHIGSFSTLALFNFFARKQKVNLVLTHSDKQNELLKTLFKAMGVNEAWINYVPIADLLNDMPELEDFKFVPTPHVEEFDSFGLVFTHKQDGVIYYSADTNTSKYLEQYLYDNNLDKIYMDTCKADYPGNVHLCSRLLAEIVPQNLRHKVYCMHIDNSDYIKDLKEMGFNVVEVK